MNEAIILSIGDELASGVTVNTNASWMAQQLSAIGISARTHVTVQDDLMGIVTAIRTALEHLTSRGGVLLISGGLGPTEDDLTRQALADALMESLVEDPSAVIQIEQWFTSKNRPMSASNRLQALRPQSAQLLENTTGTAPGLYVEKEHARIFVMPGVPGEMKTMFTKSVLPRLTEGGVDPDAQTILITKLNTFGRGESIVGEQIKDLMVRGGNPSVGTTVHDGIISVRIYATGKAAAVKEMTERTRVAVYERLGGKSGIAFSEGEGSLEGVVAEILKANRYTIATAESCTGGLLATLLTDIAGSSAYFTRGWITYANEAKHEELSVHESLIEKHGAVSKEVAVAMADGARRFAKTDFALATTGIAGPDGGSEQKPVGTVWIALSTSEATRARRFVFPGDRKAIRLRAAQMALAVLRWQLLGVDVPLT